MVKKRRLSPKSVWDEADLTEAFREEGIKEYHVQKLHRRVRWLHQCTTSVCVCVWHPLQGRVFRTAPEEQVA